MMKWVLIAIAVVVVWVVVVVLIGLTMPIAHHATRMARFNQTPAALFAAIRGPQDWRAQCEPVASQDGVRRWRELSRHGAITFEQVACDPPRLFRLRIADKNLPFGGTWTWEITPADAGCICRITEDGEVYNPIFRVLSRWVMGYHRTMDDYLNALAKKFGQTIQIEP